MTGKEKKTGGIPLHGIIIILVIISVIIAFFLLYSMQQTAKSCGGVHQAAQDYIDCRNSAYSMQKGCDFLTDRARGFVVTGNIEQAELYFNEVLVEQSRERALEEVRERLTGETATEEAGKRPAYETALQDLDTALALSNELMETDCYAMRLAIEGNGDDILLYPEPLQEVVLSQEHKALSSPQKLDLARDMVFGQAYEEARGQIDARISLFLEGLEESMPDEQADGAQRLQNLLTGQKLLLGGLMLCILAIAIVIFCLVIHPLRRHIYHISHDEKLEEAGTAELKFFAGTYNRMFEQTRKTHEKLSFEATHDPLTGLYNRSAYDNLRAEYADADIALLVIDVDGFKSINDTYGHDVGDKVLIRVAEVLRGSFRGEDMVCRIGGDEFSVIMVHAGSSLTELIRSKISRATERLSRTEEGMPAVTLSVGVAFADQREEGEDLFKNADLALYKVKEHGKNGCGFYQPEMEL